MKKKTALSLAILTLIPLLLLTACGSSGVDVPDGMKLVSSDAEAFYLFVPGTWVPNDSTGIASAYYSDKDRSNVSLTCMVPTDVTTLDGYVEKCRAELAAAIPNYAPVGEVTDAVLGERNGKSFEYTSSIADVNYKYRQIVVIYKNMFYIFTYTSTPEGYDLHADEVEQIIAKVKFK